MMKTFLYTIMLLMTSNLFVRSDITLSPSKFSNLNLEPACSPIVVNSTSSTNNTKKETLNDVETIFCTSSTGKDYISDNIPELMDYLNNQEFLVIRDDYFKCCTKDNTLCLTFDPCITRMIKSSDMNYLSFYSFISGSATKSTTYNPVYLFNNTIQLSSNLMENNIDVQICFYSSYNKKDNARNNESDSNKESFIKFEVYDKSACQTDICDVSEAKIVALYPPIYFGNRCNFFNRLSKTGQKDFIITCTVAPIIIFLIVFLYSIFLKFVLVKETKNFNIKLNEPVENVVVNAGDEVSV